MALIPLGWGPSTPGAYQVGTYVKFHELPSAPTTLVQFDAGVTGNIILAYWPDSQLTYDVTVLGHRVYGSINPHTQMHVDDWWWVVLMWGINQGGTISAAGQAWGPGGNTDGPQEDDTIPNITARSADCSLGWGVHLSTGYSDFANITGNEMTALWFKKMHDNAVNMTHVIQPPGSEPAVDVDTLGLWLCHEPVGSATVLHDASTNHYDLDQGPQGCIVVRDAPY